MLKKALDDNPIGITIYPSQRSITDLTFADYIAVLAESMDSTQIMIDHIIRMAASVDLKLNCQKSKYMTANIDPINPNSSLTIENEPMEQVTSFTYLGSKIALLVVVTLYCHLVTSTSEISHQPAHTYMTRGWTGQEDRELKKITA